MAETEQPERATARPLIIVHSTALTGDVREFERRTAERTRGAGRCSLRASIRPHECSCEQPVRSPRVHASLANLSRHYQLVGQRITMTSHWLVRLQDLTYSIS